MRPRRPVASPTSSCKMIRFGHASSCRRQLFAEFLQRVRRVPNRPLSPHPLQPLRPVRHNLRWQSNLRTWTTRSRPPPCTHRKKRRPIVGLLTRQCRRHLQHRRRRPLLTHRRPRNRRRRRSLSHRRPALRQRSLLLTCRQSHSRRLRQLLNRRVRAAGCH